ncbi:MAG TPA: hypothetical protein ENJ95_17220, partial [Bacteroidetes bacterium]|nr:hypothetical protein [Bacteroidota bacterium]
MKELKDLIQLITRHKRKSLNVIGYDKTDDRYELFYNRLEKGMFDSDDDAARFFFGDDKDGKFTQYKNFKNRFFRRLVNAVFHLDLKKAEFNDAQIGFYNCWKYLAVAKILSTFGAHGAAKKINKKVLSAAIKFELTAIVLELSRQSLYHYTTREPNEKKREYFKKLVNKSIREHSITIRAEVLYNDLIAPFVLSRSAKPWVGEEARRCLKELEPYVGKINSYRFHLCYFLIKSLEREIIYDYPGVVAVSREALRHFEKKNSTPKTTFAIFGNTLLVGLTMTKKYEEAEEVARRSLNMVEKYSIAWYKINELYMALKFHKKDYQQAYEVLRDAINNRRFKYLPPAERETWKIHEGYIHLLIAAGKIEQPEADKKKFRPARFLNEIPHFSKDKRGMNIPVLLIHAVYLLYQKRYDDFYDRVLALEKYNDRYLREGESTFRSWCIIQALHNIKKADFKKEEAQEKSAELLRRMSTQPVQFLLAPHEVEAIPYEHIWDMAMEA